MKPSRKLSLPVSVSLPAPSTMASTRPALRELPGEAPTGRVNNDNNKKSNNKKSNNKKNQKPKKAVKTLNKITAKDAAKAKQIPTTMPRAAAHEVIANVSPNAFISPNPPDVMRMAKAVFGN